jgi:hypothetical protein
LSLLPLRLPLVSLQSSLALFSLPMTLLSDCPYGSSVNRRIQVYFANVDWRERNATPGYTQYRWLQEITQKHLAESTHYPSVTNATTRCVPFPPIDIKHNNPPCSLHHSL